jgi:hypothetical protein
MRRNTSFAVTGTAVKHCLANSSLRRRAQSMGMQPSSLPPIALLRSLPAVRRYADCPVPDDVMLSVLEVARWTGLAKNTQPWELVVVRDRATLAELATCGPYAGHLAGAAAAIVW